MSEARCSLCRTSFPHLPSPAASSCPGEAPVQITHPLSPEYTEIYKVYVINSIQGVSKKLSKDPKVSKKHIQRFPKHLQEQVYPISRSMSNVHITDLDLVELLRFGEHGQNLCLIHVGGQQLIEHLQQSSEQ